MKPLLTPQTLSAVRQDLLENLFDLQCDVLMLDAFLSYDIPYEDLAEHFCNLAYWDTLSRLKDYIRQHAEDVITLSEGLLCRLGEGERLSPAAPK